MKVGVMRDRLHLLFTGAHRQTRDGGLRRSPSRVPDRHRLGVRNMRIRPGRSVVGAVFAASIVATGIVVVVPSISAEAAAPTVTIVPESNLPTNASPVNFTVTFSEAVTGFVNGEVNLVASDTGGTLMSTITGGPTVHTVGV